ncbi:hypothetical protein LTR86_009607 [Recurvomyces mirabilis]|nr:hypothetical protein LTR86_009607 [Recurvomyces mirabilis]
MKCAIHVMPLKRPLGSLSATPFNRRAPEPSHKYAVTAELDETVQDIVTKAEAQLQKLYGIDTAMTYFSRVKDSEGLDIAMTMKLGELMTESTPAAERSFTLYQDWLDNKDTLPQDSPLRPTTHSKRKFDSLSVAEKQAFKVLKTAYAKEGEAVFMRAADGTRKPNEADARVIDSQASLPTPRNSSMPPPPTSAQRPPRSSPLQRAPQSSYDEDLLQTFSSNEEVAAELESDHNAFEIMSSQQRQQMPPPNSSQRSSVSVQPPTQTPQQPPQSSHRSKPPAPIRPPRKSKPLPSTEDPTPDSSRPGRSGRTFTKICWEDDEDRIIGAGFAAGLTAEKIRKRYDLNRTASGIRARKLLLQRSRPEVFVRGVESEEGGVGGNEVEGDEIEDEEEEEGEEDDAFEPVRDKVAKERMVVMGEGVEEECEEDEPASAGLGVAEQTAEEIRESDQDDPDSAVADLDTVQKRAMEEDGGDDGDDDGDDVHEEHAVVVHPEVVIPVSSFLGRRRDLEEEVAEDVEGAVVEEVVEEVEVEEGPAEDAVEDGDRDEDGYEVQSEDVDDAQAVVSRPVRMPRVCRGGPPVDEKGDADEEDAEEQEQDVEVVQTQLDVTEVASEDEDEAEDGERDDDDHPTPAPSPSSSSDPEDDLIRLADREGIQYYNEHDGRAQLLRYLRPDMKPTRIVSTVNRVFRHAAEEVLEWHVRWLTIKRDLLNVEKGSELEAGLVRGLETMIYYRDLRRPDCFADGSLLPEMEMEGESGGGAVVVPRRKPWEVVPKTGAGRVLEEVFEIEEEARGVEVEVEVGDESMVSAVGEGSGVKMSGADGGRVRSKRARRHAAAAAARRRRRDIRNGRAGGK